MGDRRERVTPRSPTRSRVWGEGMLDESIFWRSEKRCHISVDAESYRAKREESLVRLADYPIVEKVKIKLSKLNPPLGERIREVNITFEKEATR